MLYNVELVRNRFNQGEKLEFRFFWGHKEIPGMITNACLSQWYPCVFMEDEITYYTAEQYMMAQKAILFGDEEIREKIMLADGPSRFKKLGRQIRGFDDKIWNKHKYEIVLNGNLAKFSQNPELKEFLLATGDAVLAEASPYDEIWGIHMSATDSKVWNPNNWKGVNLLGFALMEARERLRAEHQYTPCPSHP